MDSHMNVRGKSGQDSSKRVQRVTAPIPFLVLIIALAPILFSPSDMWDGRILSFAHETSDASGIRYWLLQSGWHLQYWLSIIQFYAANTLNVSFFTVHKITLLISMISIVVSVGLWSRLIFGLPPTAVFVSRLLASTFPILHVGLSSVHSAHFVFLALGMWSAVLVTSARRFFQALGLLLAIISFELSSLLVLLPTVLFLGDLLTPRKKMGGRRWSLRPVTMLAAAVLYFAADRTLFGPSGPYVGYNGFVFPATIVDIAELLEFSSFLAIPVVATGIGALTLFFFARKPPEVESIRETSLSRQKGIVILALFLGSILPYVAVAKPTHLMDTLEWDQRQAIILLPTLPIITAIILEEVASRAVHHRIGYIAMVASIAVILQATVLAQGYAPKTQRLHAEAALVTELRKLYRDNPPDALAIFVRDFPGPPMRMFESGFLYWEAFGALPSQIRIVPSDSERQALLNDDAITFFQIDDDPKPSTVRLISSSDIRCTGAIEVDFNGYSGIASVIKGGFGVSPQFAQIVGSRTSCIH